MINLVKMEILFKEIDELFKELKGGEDEE